MIPEITDKRWEELVLGAANYQFQLLSLKILMNRIKINVKNDNSTTCIERCKQEVYNFFLKNEKISQKDLSQIFNQV